MTRINQLRIEKKLTMRDTAKGIGIPYTTYVGYEKGDREPNSEMLIKIASFFSVSVDYLIGRSDDREPYGSRWQSPTITDDTVFLPVVGELAAGFNNLAFEDWQGESVEIPRNYLKGHSKEDFIVLSVKGDSMFPTYQNGDKVVILRQADIPFSGAIGAVRYSDDLATLKIVEKRTDEKGADYIRLRPINPQYPPQDIKGEDLDHYGVIGVPKLLIREIEE